MGNTVDFKKIAKIIGIILIVGFFIFFIYLYIGSQPKKISDELVTSEGFEDLSVKWAGFKGHKAGPKVIQFLQQVANNAENHQDDPMMLPDICYKFKNGGDYSIINSTVEEPCFEEIREIESEIDSQHSYNIEFKYSKKGILNGIIIKYEKNDKVNFVPDDN